MNFGLKEWLLVALAIFTLVYTIVFARATLGPPDAQGAEGKKAPSILDLVTGFVTNFFDTLGIGSFAPTTAAFRQFKMLRDEHIPGTLNVGHTLPAILQAFIFITVVPVEAQTLVLMIGAAVAGAWLGAGIVSGLSRRHIQVGMGVALMVAGVIMLVRTLRGDPAGADALGLSGAALVMGVTGNFVLGAFMTLGIGLYAPCMILVSMLGMNPLTAFPIMMGSCAFLMPVASMRFIRERAYNSKVALGLLVGGIPAVLIAVFIVKSLPLTAVKYLVVVVVVYTAVGLLRSARAERAAGLAGAGVPVG